VDAVDLSVEYGRIPLACRRYGLSRSRLYRLAAEDLIRFVKVGSATLVDFDSVRSYLASCEKAQIRASGQRTTAQAPQASRPAAASARDVRNADPSGKAGEIRGERRIAEPPGGGHS
jgi:hypothetical protein